MSLDCDTQAFVSAHLSEVNDQWSLVRWLRGRLLVLVLLLMRMTMMVGGPGLRDLPGAIYLTQVWETVFGALGPLTVT